MNVAQVLSFVLCKPCRYFVYASFVDVLTSTSKGYRFRLLTQSPISEVVE